MEAPLSGRVRAGAGAGLRVGFVPGVQPDKWVRRHRERNPGIPLAAELTAHPLEALASTPGAAGFDVVFVREPDDSPRSAPPGLLRIPLYTETMAVLAPKGHELGAFETVDLAELDGQRWVDADQTVDPIAASLDEVAGAVELVAAGVGLLVLPQPYARHLSRRDVLIRELTGVPATRIGVAWAAEREGESAIDEFVGVVRGRTANSSRGETRPRRRR